MSARAVLFPVAALVLVVAVLAIQLAAGGADYEPQAAASPCADRAVPPIPTELEPLAERIVLIGLDETACELNISRERLVLSLAVADDRRALARSLGTDERGLARELKAGLGRAIARLERSKRLPRVSALLPSVLDESGLPDTAQTLIEAIPDGTVDDLLPTGPVLRRAVAKVDVDTVLSGLQDPAKLEPALRDAILDAAQDEIRVRLEERVPDSLRDLLGG